LGQQWKWGVERNPIVSGGPSNETSTDDAPVLGDETRRRRFDGFMSWENMLQEWADDVQEYLDQVERESIGQDYALGNFGRASKVRNTDATTETKKEEIEPIDVTGISSNISMVVEESVDETMEGTAPALKEESMASNTNGGSTRRSAKTPPLPIPAPAQPGEEVLPHTDLSDLSKRVEIVTTASLPWRTGTAVNPLLRAAYLTHGRAEAGGSVTLMLPWLERKGDQEKIYGKSQTFDSPSDQEAYIRDWLRDTANMPEAANDLRIRWYTAWQNPAENSIYSMGDITALIPPEEVDICILEEPEHLNWYRAPGESWTKRFKHVVGILHTNYFSYAMDQPAAIVRAPGMRLLCSWMCRAHCHRIIKLSGTLDKMAPEKELVENVHGVRGTFIDIGTELRDKLMSPSISSDPVFAAEAESTIYFIGKMLWSKGLGSLMELLKYAEESADIKIKVDMYGGGPDQDAAKAKAQSLELDMPFHGPVDHAELAFTHKIFVNPSTSEVLCTTSAEALAMGKFVIIPSHVSNDFFAQFPNCLTYTTRDEFVGNLFYAMTHSPEPLSEEYTYALTWKAATERLIAAAAVPVEEAKQREAALASDEAGIDISLPPLVESEEGRKMLSTTFRFTRHRYRLFRSRLSSEIMQNKFLPQSVKERLAQDLEKRLDIDIDEIIESPKLRVKISPAVLDKQLLELYNRVTSGPQGDVLRLIGGGGQVGLQNMYMRRVAQKQKKRTGSIPDPIPFYLQSETDDNPRTVVGGIRRALRRNLPKNDISVSQTPKMNAALGKSYSNPDHKSASIVPEQKDTPKMSSTALHAHLPSSRVASTPPSQFTTRKPFSLLI